MASDQLQATMLGRYTIERERFVVEIKTTAALQTDARNVQLVIALGWTSTARQRIAGASPP